MSRSRGNLTNRYREAFRLLDAYRQGLVDQATDRILERGRDLNRPFSNEGEEIVERYGHLLCLTRTVLCEIARCIPSDLKPDRVHATTLSCATEELARTVDSWLQEHPEQELVSVQVVPATMSAPAGENCTILILHRDSSPIPREKEADE